MPDVLVTGATGFVGSVLTRRLVSEGFDVRILRRSSSKLDLIGDIERSVEHVIGEITDPLVLDDAMRGIERVFHAAAYVGFGGRGEHKQLLAVNVDGTAAVVDAALKQHVGRLLHFSSMAAFGRPDRPGQCIDEDSTWQRSKANSFYGYSKYLSELEVQRGIAEGLDAVIVNPSLIFGVGRAGDNTRRIVDRIRTESLPAIPAGGTNVVDVEDVVDGALRAIELAETGERYFLGSENLAWSGIIGAFAREFNVDPPRFSLGRRSALTLAYIAEGVSALTRSTPLITRESARTASRSYCYDNTKARSKLDWAPRPFDETVRRIAAELGTRSPSPAS